MPNEADRQTDGTPRGCGIESCRGKMGPWIWVILVVAVAGVLIARNIASKKDAQRIPASGIASNAIPTANGPSHPEPTHTKALPRLVDLGATQCMLCKMMAPILKELKQTHAGKMNVEFIDVRENPEAGKKYGVNLIPTQIFFDAAGKELFRHEGFLGKDDILAKWKELGVDLSSGTP